MGKSKGEVDAFSLKTANAAVNDLLTLPTIPPPPIDPQTNQTWIINGKTGANSNGFLLYKYVGAWWIHEAFTTPAPNIAQQMTFFLHQNFACNVKIPSTCLYNQLKLFRHYAIGSYKTLAKKMCVDNGMLIFLDGTLSSKGDPNENFPRELLELFTIGKGPQIGPGNYTNYTETDIQEASRLFTGFKHDLSYQTIDPDTGIPMGTIDLWQHDWTDKHFGPSFKNGLGHTITGRNTAAGMFDEISDFIDMVFDEDETAKNICRKLYRWFVHYDITPAVEQDIISPLATDLKANNYVLEGVLKKLLKSKHFYDMDDSVSNDEIIGGIIKNPIELFVGTFKYFDVELPDPAVNLDRLYRQFYYENFIQFLCQQAGIDPFNPPSVAGYVPYHQAPTYDDLWVNSSSLAIRYMFAEMLLSGSRILVGGSLQVKLDVVELVKKTQIVPNYVGADPAGVRGVHQGARIPNHLVAQLLAYAFPEGYAASRFNYFLNDLLLDNLSAINWMTEWDNYITTGNDAIIRPQLEDLVRGIIMAPEFQLK